MYLFMDFETYSPISIDHGVKKYATHPEADVICGVFSLVGQDRKPIYEMIYNNSSPEKFSQQLELIFQSDSKFIIAHNIEFDIEIYNSILVKKYNFPTIPQHIKFICTQKRQNFLVQPASLKLAAKFHKLAEQKDDRGSFLIKQLSIPNKDSNRNRNPELEREMLEYCRQDVNTTIELFFRQQDFMKDFLVKNNDFAMQTLDLKINRTGMPVNVGLASKLTEVAQAQMAQAQLDACILCEDFGLPSLTQVAALKNYIKAKFDYEIHSFDLKKQTHENAPTIVKQILELRELCTQNSLSKAKVVVDNSVDGRLYNQLRYCGTHTGRWAGRDFQPQNLPREHDENEPSSFLRNIIATGADSSLITLDYSAIEHRAIFYLAMQFMQFHDLNCESTKNHFMKFFTNEDSYIELAAKIYDMPANLITKKSHERQVGKTAHLGLGYGMGIDKFITSSKQQAGLEFSQVEAQKIVSIYRSTYTMIPKMWYSLLKDVISLVFIDDDATVDIFGSMQLKYRSEINNEKGSNCLCIVLPSGRPMFYYDLKIEQQEFNGNLKDSLKIGYHFTHGGELIENIVQAFCRDLLAYHMVKLDVRLKEAKIILHVHDEIVVESSDLALDSNFDLMQNLKADLPAWCEGFPVDVEMATGKYYTK